MTNAIRSIDGNRARRQAWRAGRPGAVVGLVSLAIATAYVGILPSLGLESWLTLAGTVDVRWAIEVLTQVLIGVTVLMLALAASSRSRIAAARRGSDGRDAELIEEALGWLWATETVLAIAAVVLQILAAIVVVAAFISGSARLMSVAAFVFACLVSAASNDAGSPSRDVSAVVAHQRHDEKHRVVQSVAAHLPNPPASWRSRVWRILVPAALMSGLTGLVTAGWHRMVGGQRELTGPAFEMGTYLGAIVMVTVVLVLCLLVSRHSVSAIGVLVFGGLCSSLLVRLLIDLASATPWETAGLIVAVLAPTLLQILLQVRDGRRSEEKSRWTWWRAIDNAEAAFCARRLSRFRNEPRGWRWWRAARAGARSWDRILRGTADPPRQATSGPAEGDGLMQPAAGSIATST